MEKISIINYGLGNVGSIKNILSKVGAEADFVSKPEEVLQATKLILPGVGAFDAGMQRLKDLGLIEALRQRVLVDRVPILGICLGMQLLTLRSQEGTLEGLGWIPIEFTKFDTPAGTNLKVPHMGWNVLQVVQDAPLLRNMDDKSRFYFVHSYYASAGEKRYALATTVHGQPFASVIGHENVVGVQFHPEKSHRFGKTLLRNFVEFY